jgi:hypothetical protein
MRRLVARQEFRYKTEEMEIFQQSSNALFSFWFPAVPRRLDFGSLLNHSGVRVSALVPTSERIVELGWELSLSLTATVGFFFSLVG